MVLKACSYNPAERYQTARELKNALLAAANPEPYYIYDLNGEEYDYALSDSFSPYYENEEEEPITTILQQPYYYDDEERQGEYEHGEYEPGEYDQGEYEHADYERADYDHAEYEDADYDHADYEDSVPEKQRNNKSRIAFWAIIVSTVTIIVAALIIGARLLADEKKQKENDGFQDESALEYVLTNEDVQAFYNTSVTHLWMSE